MQIRILKFIPDQKGIKQGFVDFHVDHGNGKIETFRHMPFFEKDTKRWIGTSNVERNGKWLPRYERTPSLGNMFQEALKALDDYLKENERPTQDSNFWAN